MAGENGTNQGEDGHTIYQRLDKQNSGGEFMVGKRQAAIKNIGT